MAGTFNGNPLTMAATKATLTEVLTRDVYDHFNAIHKVLADGCSSVIEKYRLPAYVIGPGREGLGHLQRDAGARVPRRRGDRRADHVPRLALPAEPRRVQVAVDEAGDLDDLGVPHRRGRRRATWTTSRSSPPPSRRDPPRRSRRRLRRHERHGVLAGRGWRPLAGRRASPGPKTGSSSSRTTAPRRSGRPFATVRGGGRGARAPAGDVHPPRIRGVHAQPRPFRRRLRRRYRADRRSSGGRPLLHHGIVGRGPHALACAALLPDRVIACATTAGVGPFDADGLGLPGRAWRRRTSRSWARPSKARKHWRSSS